MFKSVKFGLFCVYAATSFVTASGQKGSMHGGQQPLVGSRVYLLTPAQSTTQGAASVSLLTSGAGSDQIGIYVLTDSNGDSEWPNYSCPSANAPVYLYTSGGNAQAGYGANAAISELVYVGPCGTINSQTFVYADEVTTVAMAYAVAGYATDPLHISYSGSQASLTGIENAFANANNLASSYSEFGSAYSEIPSGNASAPQQAVDTIADAIGNCINQTSGAQSCSTLFSAAPVNGNGVAPTDTATAVMNIAHNPANSTSPKIQNGTNIASIWGLALDYQQYTISATTAAPNDFTVGLTFSSSNFGYPTALAIDGSGNAWIASQQFSPSLPNGSVVEIASPTAMLANNVTYPVDYTPQTEEPESIAVDAASQNTWIGTDDAVEEFSTTGGAPASGSPFLKTDPNFGGGYGLNLDSAGNVWIAAYSSVYELSATGSVLSPSVSTCGSGYCLPAGGSAVPSGIALDASNNVWVTDYNNNALVEFNPQGTVSPNPDLIPTDFSEPNGVAIDANGSKWVANFGSNDFTRYAPTVIPPVMYSVADAPLPPSSPTLTFVGIDGAGNSWLSLQDAACSSTSTCLGVAEVSGAGTPLSGPGYIMDGNQPPSQNATASATAIDGSGNVWILNKYAQTVTELIGAAAPVVTPLALAVSSNSLGVRP
jgi:streptogramin lyase